MRMLSRELFVAEQTYGSSNLSCMWKALKFAEAAKYPGMIVQTQPFLFQHNSQPDLNEDHCFLSHLVQVSTSCHHGGKQVSV